MHRKNMQKNALTQLLIAVIKMGLLFVLFVYRYTDNMKPIVNLKKKIQNDIASFYF